MKQVGKAIADLGGGLHTELNTTERHWPFPGGVVQSVFDGKSSGYQLPHG